MLSFNSLRTNIELRWLHHKHRYAMSMHGDMFSHASIVQCAATVWMRVPDVCVQWTLDVRANTMPFSVINIDTLNGKEKISGQLNWIFCRCRFALLKQNVSSWPCLTLRQLPQSKSIYKVINLFSFFPSIFFLSRRNTHWRIIGVGKKFVIDNRNISSIEFAATTEFGHIVSIIGRCIRIGRQSHSTDK